MIKDQNPSAENWPKPRYRTSCSVYKDAMYMYGGHDGTRQLSDFYKFDFQTEKWAQLSTNTAVPSPRDSHISVIYKDSMFIFGGSTGINQNKQPNFYEFDFGKQTWFQVESLNEQAPSRFCHTGVILNKSMYIFGGYDGITRLNDIFIFHFEQDTLDVPKSTLN